MTLAIPSGISLVWDFTGSNFDAVTKIMPRGITPAGYRTGNGVVPWTAAQFDQYPDAINIDQTAVSGPWDVFSDVDDVENGAVQLNEIAGRAKERISAYQRGIHPGQRMPLVYASASRITDVANALVAGGVNSGVGLWVADWSTAQSIAIEDVIKASGPFPIHGYQWFNEGLFDVSVFSTAWLNTRSAKPVTEPPTDQSGLIVSFTTQEFRRVTSGDHGATWK